MSDRQQATRPGGLPAHFRRIHGRDRVLTLTGLALTTAVPLTVLLHTPTTPLTLAAATVLCLAAPSLAHALQRTWEAAWDLPPAPTGTRHALTALALLAAGVTALTLLTTTLHTAPLNLLTQTIVSIALWTELQHLLLTRRVPRPHLLPGAAITGTAQALACVCSATWLPQLLRTTTAHHGTSAAALTALTWLLALAAGTVTAAVASARTGQRHPPPPPHPPPARPPPPRRHPYAIHDDGYGTVLLTVLATVAWTAAAPATTWGWTTTLLLLTATLTGVLRASLARQRLRRASAALWTAAVLLALGTGTTGRAAAGVAVLGVLLLAGALFAVLHRLTQQTTVTRETVQAAVSAYLLLGLLFTFGYATATQLGTHSLAGTDADDTLATCLYFSFVTLTTTGYGDVTAATDLTRAMAVVEALTGQLYLVTVLALAVARLPTRPDPPH